MPIEKIINNVSENLRTDDYYKNAGQHQLGEDMLLLFDLVETLEELENKDFRNATAGQKEVERRRRKLNQKCLEVLLVCQKMNNKLFDTWVFKKETEQKMEPLLEEEELNQNFGHNATSNPYLVDFKWV